jgi:hypothetical protein
VVIRPIDDREVELVEIVSFTLSAGGSYDIGSMNTAVITILDNDLLLFGTGSW